MAFGIVEGGWNNDHAALLAAGRFAPALAVQPATPAERRTVPSANTQWAGGGGYSPSSGLRMKNAPTMSGSDTMAAMTNAA
ncbi:hypothetical protein GCM10009776_21360 [Microbacterium deminutum]|uniref:Uncharacterized protein n=1 Tax=Microbacterium deminutum TaxID=344164 RepID=A0ABN2QVB4_9MICO